MATRLLDAFVGALPELRTHPTEKRIRALVGDTVVVDTRSATILWEPRRVVPSYAVPVADLRAVLVDADGADVGERPVRVGDGPPVLDPSTPFAAHSCPGHALTLRTEAGDLPGAAFAPDDPDLAGQVALDWGAFTRWFEEDEEVFAHPRDPFGRIDCLRSSRRVTVSLDGAILADSQQPTLLLETKLPTRYYLPRSDVRTELLEPSGHHSTCAYKGRASYWSARVGGELVPDVAWGYDNPLHDASPVRGLIAFVTERLDLELDDVPVERLVTPWS